LARSAEAALFPNLKNSDKLLYLCQCVVCDVLTPSSSCVFAAWLQVDSGIDSMGDCMASRRTMHKVTNYWSVSHYMAAGLCILQFFCHLLSK